MTGRDGPWLVVMIGPAGAGKSTYAGRRWPGRALSLDSCRALVSGDAGDQDATTAALPAWRHRLAGLLADGGGPAVADATSTEPAARASLVQLADQCRARAGAVLLVPPLADCLARNASRTGSARVPDRVIAEQHARAAALTDEQLQREGFAYIQRVAPAEADAMLGGERAARADARPAHVDEHPVLGTVLGYEHVSSGVAPPGRLPVAVWAALLADADTVRRYRSRVYRRAEGECWPWLGTISSTGHGKLRAGTRVRNADPVTGRDRPESRVVTAHVFGWQLANGLITAGGSASPAVSHRCDEAWCQNPAHWHLVDVRKNTLEWAARRYLPGGHPLADVRGARGRAVAIRDAVKAAISAGADVDAAIWRAACAGIRDVGQDPLF